VDTTALLVPPAWRIRTPNASASEDAAQTKDTLLARTQSPACRALLVVALFHGRVEGIHVDVDNLAHKSSIRICPWPPQ
jgi:hypothetical protein